MATSVEFATYVLDQLQLLDGVKSKKMFGEYGVFYKDKMVAIIADNVFFVKQTAQGREFLGTFELAPPYPGAKEYFLMESLEDKELLAKLIEITYSHIPLSKTKKKNS